MVERVSRGERENRIKEDKWAQHGCRDHSHECSCIRARFTFVAFSRPAPCFFRAPGKHFLRYVKKISFFLYYCSKIEPLVFTSLFRIFDCNCKSKYQPPPLIPIKKENSQHSLLHKERKKERNYLTLSTPFFLDCHNYSFYFNINLVEWLRETESRGVFQRSDGATPLHAGRRRSAHDRWTIEERGVRRTWGTWWWKYKARRVAGLGQSVNG